MRRHARTLLTVAALGSLLGCDKGAPPDAPAAVPAAGDPPPRTGTAPAPRIWLDEDATSAVRVLGYAEAHVFRWQGNVPDGWVEFNGEGGARRQPLDWGPTLAR